MTNKLRSLLLLGALGLAGCADFTLYSQWRRAEISVDGDDSDWVGADETKFGGLTLRAVNDADSLYVCVRADAEDLKRQLDGDPAWTLRFSSKQPGFRPWGLRVDRVYHPATEPGEGPVSTPRATVLGPDGREQALDPDGGGPIDFASREHYGSRVAEFKVPLSTTDSAGVALGLSPGAWVELDLALPAAGTPHRGGGQAGGRGGRHGGHGGHGLGGGMGAGLAGGGRSEEAEAPPSPQPEANGGGGVVLLRGSLRLAKAP